MIEKSKMYKSEASDVYKFDDADQLPGSSSSSPASTSTSPSISSSSESFTATSDSLVMDDMSKTDTKPDHAPSDQSLPTVPLTLEPRKKKPYKELTLEEKVQLIRLAEDNAGLSQAAIAERYKIAKSNVCRILQRKSEYLTAYESAGFAGNRKRKLKAEEPKTLSASVCTTNNNLMLTSSTSALAPSSSVSTAAAAAAALQMSTASSSSGLLMDNASVHQQNYLLSGPPNGTTHPSAVHRTALPSSSSGGLLVPAPFSFDGNETLRAHMYKQHQISRMFMCRCCNWAFPDKTSLHMHIQAREEGKSVSVPVIGKGMTTDGLAIETSSFTPLLQINNNNNNIHNNNNNSINNNNSAAPHVVPAIPPPTLSGAPPTSALSFFPTVTPNGLTTSDELGRLRERIMINQLMNQHAFNNTFSWLNQLPKPIPTTRPLDLPHTADPEEDLVINVEKDVDSPKRDMDDEKLNISICDSDDPKSEGTKRTDSPCENVCSSSTVGSSPSHTGSLPSPVNIFKKSRTSPSAFHHLNVDSRAFVSVSSPSHVSPSETNSSISPDGQERPACYECALYKTKLTMADNKCRYLESRANTLQGETVRAQTQTAAAETAIRVLESETRTLREHTESIQRKLLDCQEQALRFVQSDKTGNQQAVILFLNQLIQSTIIR